MVQKYFTLIIILVGTLHCSPTMPMSKDEYEKLDALNEQLIKTLLNDTYKTTYREDIQSLLEAGANPNMIVPSKKQSTYALLLRSAVDTNADNYEHPSQNIIGKLYAKALEALLLKSQTIITDPDAIQAAQYFIIRPTDSALRNLVELHMIKKNNYDFEPPHLTEAIIHPKNKKNNRKTCG
jgi:hypothetical protein